MEHIYVHTYVCVWSYEHAHVRVTHLQKIGCDGHTALLIASTLSLGPMGALL